jgi:hypothetical protein
MTSKDIGEYRSLWSASVKVGTCIITDESGRVLSETNI